MSRPQFWLRCEKKEFERRAALTPTTAKKLIDAGFEIFVECDEQRIFDDSEYEAFVKPANNFLPIISCLTSSIHTGLAASSLTTTHGRLHRHRFPSLG
jgi:hypothetical protein